MNRKDIIAIAIVSLVTLALSGYCIWWGLSHGDSIVAGVGGLLLVSSFYLWSSR